MSKRTKITEEVEIKLVELYKNGLNGEQCAKILNISSSSVYIYIRRHKLTRTNSESLGVNKNVLNDALKEYKKGLSASACSKIYNLSIPTILSHAKKLGIKRTKEQNLKVTKELEIKICELYINGLNAAQVERLLKISDVTVLDVIDRNKIKRKTQSEAKRKLKINDHYFDTINSEDKAYFLGLLISDGFVKPNGFGISLVKTDEKILKQMIKYMEGGKIYYPTKGKHQEMSRLDVTSPPLRAALTKLGCIQAKTHFTYFPDIPENLWNHFIRGVFDGDGSVGIYKLPYFNLMFSFIGNNLLIEKIQEILMKECQLNKTSIRSPKNTKNNIVVFQYNGTNNFIRFREYLYKNATIYLQRKYDKFFIEFEEKLPTIKYGKSYRHT